MPQQEGTDIRLQQDGFLDKDLRPADSLAAECPINQVWSWDRSFGRASLNRPMLQFLFLPGRFLGRRAAEQF